MRASQVRQIRNVIAIFLSAFLTAGALAAYMLYHYNPSGRYVAGNTILSPSVINQLNYNDLNPQTGTSSKFVFNGIEFSYFDKINEKPMTLTVTPENYKTFYQWIQTEKSVENANDDLIRKFRPQNPTLTLTVRAESGALPVTKMFQIVQFTEDDYFRIQLLHAETGADTWAYFYRPQIYQDSVQLFTTH